MKHPLHAFTLIELLVVSAIIAVLVALFTPTMMDCGSSAKRVGCAAIMYRFGTAIHTYVGDSGYMSPIWERDWYDRPVRGLAGRGRGYTLVGILRRDEVLPDKILRCPPSRDTGRLSVAGTANGESPPSTDPAQRLSAAPGGPSSAEAVPTHHVMPGNGLGGSRPSRHLIWPPSLTSRGLSFHYSDFDLVSNC